MSIVGDIVVLLHGIGRSGRSLRSMEATLKSAGYATLNISYPWRECGLAGLASFLDLRLKEEGVWALTSRVNFVTHSMGGLVAAQFLSDFRDRIPTERLGRIVMLAPPNRGSEVADLLNRLPLYHRLYGPAGAELTTRSRASPPAATYELGIIAGTKGWPYLLGAFIPGPHDGRVSVERTKLDGMTDHVVVPATHTFIANRRDVQSQVLSFLAEARFAR